MPHSSPALARPPSHPPLLARRCPAFHSSRAPHLAQTVRRDDPETCRVSLSPSSSREDVFGVSRRGEGVRLIFPPRSGRTCWRERSGRRDRRCPCRPLSRLPVRIINSPGGCHGFDSPTKRGRHHGQGQQLPGQGKEETQEGREDGSRQRRSAAEEVKSSRRLRLRDGTT